MTDEEKKLKPNEVAVDSKVLEKVLEGQAKMEQEIENLRAKNQGLEELFAAEKGADTTGDKKLRERRNYEPAFRTVRLRKYPMGGDHEKMGYIIGWTNRGAYQKVDRTGVTAQIVDYIDVIFLDHERDTKGGIQAESIPLMSILNEGVPVHCKILEIHKETFKDPTGEVINVTMYDPQHGLVSTGEEIDGWVGRTEMQYTIQIPGREKPLKIDAKYVN